MASRDGREGRASRGEQTAAGPAGPSSPAGVLAAFVDSSAIVALVDRDDRSHAAAVEAYRSLVASGYQLFTTNLVMAEAFDLLTAGAGAEAARVWLRDARLAVYIADEVDHEKARTRVLVAGARPLSLTDAVSIVVMERLGVADAFAVDPTFLAALM